MAKAPDTERRLSPATIVLAVAGLIFIVTIVIVTLSRFSPFTAGSNVAATNMAANATNAATPADAIATLRQRVAQNPDDAEGWYLLGSAYRRAAQEAQSESDGLAGIVQAEQAYRRAMELDPRNAEHLGYLAESLLVQGDPAKLREARQLLERASQIDPREPMVRYYRATLKDSDGDHPGAVNDLIALLRDAPPGASWAFQVRATVQQIAQRNNIDIASRLPPPHSSATATAAIPGPDRQAMEAARTLPPAQQDQMVRGMVDGLAARLQRNPRDADGWIRLMRSRVVLEQRAEAQQALRSGLQAFQDDTAAQQRLREAAGQLGIPAG